MGSQTKEQTVLDTPLDRHPLALQEFLSIVRNRLNVISTSLYLLESSLEAPHPHSRYIEKMKHELEALRKLING